MPDAVIHDLRIGAGIIGADVLAHALADFDAITVEWQGGRRMLKPGDGRGLVLQVADQAAAEVLAGAAQLVTDNPDLAEVFPHLLVSVGGVNAPPP